MHSCVISSSQGLESAANNHILAERDTEERFACTKLAQRRSNLFDHLDDGRKPIDRDDATRGGGDSMEDGRAATPRYASNPPRARALKALKLPPTKPRVNYRLTPARKGGASTQHVKDWRDRRELGASIPAASTRSPLWHLLVAARRCERPLHRRQRLATGTVQNRAGGPAAYRVAGTHTTRTPASARSTNLW